jgi:hypothetical protein
MRRRITIPDDAGLSSARLVTADEADAARPESMGLDDESRSMPAMPRPRTPTDDGGKAPP